MIVTKPYLAQLGQASEAAIPSAQDGQITVAPLVFPHVPLIDPIQPGINSVPMNTSCSNHTTASRINQAGLTANVVQLGRGLWTVNWSLSLWANYDHTGIQSDCMIGILFGANARVIAEMWAAQNDSKCVTGTFRILLREVAIIQTTIGTTGVGQELLTTVGVICEKHL